MSACLSTSASQKTPNYERWDGGEPVHPGNNNRECRPDDPVSGVNTWYMLGKVGWNGVEVSGPCRAMTDYYRWPETSPAARPNEPNRVQDYYDACAAIKPPTRPASPAVSATKTAVRAIRNDPEEWALWSDLTLDQFAGTP